MGKTIFKTGDFYSNILEASTGKQVTFEKTTTWYDGSPMDDTKCDGVVYKKLAASLGGDYIKLAYTDRERKTLVLDNMMSLTALTPTSKLLIKMGFYKRIYLKGYNVVGDGGGGEFDYYPDTSKSNHDGGSVISDSATYSGPASIENFYNNVGDIDPSSPGCYIRNYLANTIDTRYYGVFPNLITETANYIGIQRTFDYGQQLDVAKCTIGPGIHEVRGPEELRYRIANSTLFYEGTLKCANNSSRSSGTQLIRYQSNNSKIINQKLDGNRLNNAMTPEKGKQFTFSAYDGEDNLQFIGGYCINALQNHMQNTSENLLLENITFDGSGEHGLYLTLTTGSPKKQIRVRNCRFLNYALNLQAVGISLRDYRHALIESCYFDVGSHTRTWDYGHIQTYIEYGSELAANESLRHIIKDCTFQFNGGLNYSVLATGSKGVNGTYISGGFLYFPTAGDILQIDNALISWTPNYRWANPPSEIKNCTILASPGYRPSRGLTFVGNRVFATGNESDGMLIDLNSQTLGNTLIENNDFYNFVNSYTFGIIRTKTGFKTVVNNNRMHDCGNSRLVRARSALDVVTNNKDMSNTGASFRHDVQPKLVSGNDFIRNWGPTSQRSHGGIAGGQYFDTDLGRPIWYNGAIWVDAMGSPV